MTVAPFENDPTDITLKVLSRIHDLSVRVNHCVGRIQAFQQNQRGFKAVELMKLLEDSNRLLKEQNQELTQLIESQLVLDDRLKAMAAIMESGTDDVAP